MKRRESLSPDLTPLIDVVFLLLIFFLVNTVFKKEELALLLNLPKSEQAVSITKEMEISIELSSDKLALGGKELSFEALEDELAKVVDKEISVSVRIDQEVAYKRVITLFDILKKHELHNLTLLSEQE